MSFTARLASDFAQVEAGGTVPFSIEVVNRSDAADHFELRIEGLDPEWTAVPVPTFSVGSGETGSERVLLKPPRISESLSGSYPFVVKIRSLNTGEERHSQGVVEIKPFHHISLDVMPKRSAISPYKKETVFSVTAMNLGNTDHTLQLYAADTEDEFAYEFSQDQISVGPGQQKDVELNVSGAKRSFLASARLHAVTISARSVQAPTVTGSTQAQIEHRALVSPGPFFMLISLILLATLWYTFLPKPPSLDSLATDKASVLAGEPIRITWRASHARSVQLKIGPSLTLENMEPSGSYDYTPLQSGLLDIYAVAQFGDKRSTSMHATVTVTLKEPAPLPRIEKFTISPKNAGRGETLLIKYEFNAAVVKATLSPPGQVLDTKIDSISVVADIPGEIEYKLVAENADGKTDIRSVKVRVVEKTEATIVVFTAEPTSVEPESPNVTLTWKLTKAEWAELSDGKSKQKVSNQEGTLEVQVTEDTTFTLTAYDANSRTVTRTVTVKVKPPPTPPTGDTTGGETTTGGGD